MTEAESQPGQPEQSRARTSRHIANRYRLDRAIAAGGMAQVWEATDVLLGRRVAVKILHPRLAADESFVTRFRREARAAAGLSHPNVVAIFDHCSEDDLEAIIMELVDGPTLRRELDERGRLEIDEALRIAIHVADALAAAHDADLVHRDIKPGNILLADATPDGDRRVLVGDFGIAKALGGDTDLTRVGTVLGTAKYLAPEQVSGGDVDARTDVYALGLVLYEMLCGRPPFDGETELAMALARTQRDPVPARRLRPEIPPAVEALLHRALARNPDERTATAAKFRAALIDARRSVNSASTAELDEQAAPQLVGDAPSFVASERGWIVPTIVVLAAVIALTLAAASFGQQDERDAGPTTSQVDQPTSSSDSEPTDLLALSFTPSAFDPEGDGSERPDLIANLIDADESTAWQTDGYNDNFPLLKAGVGLILSLDQETDIRRLVLNTTEPGWTAEISVGPQGASTRAEFGAKLSTVSAQSTTTSVNLEDARGGTVLIWFTSLPADANRFRVIVSEVELFG